MIRRTMEFEDKDEPIAAEQAVAMARELKKLADAAADGHVLAVVESAALERGRRFTRERLQAALNAQATALEKKGARPVLPVRRAAAPPRPRRAAARHRRRRGDAAPLALHLPRLRPACPPARRPARRRRLGQPARPAAVVPGRGRVVVRAGRPQPPRPGRAGRLRQHRAARPATATAARCGPGSATTPRRRGLPRGGGGRRVPDRRDLGQHDRGLARDAAGHLRQAEAGRAGRRPRRLGRPAAAGAARRGSPRPASAPATRWGRSGGGPRRGWGSRTRGRSRSSPTGPSGSGTRSSGTCPGRPGCWTSTTPASTSTPRRPPCTATGRRRGLGRGPRRTLLESGAAGLLAELEATGGRRAELAAYLEPHAGHTDYRRRLAEGRSIGSGLVEGACKTVVGRRLKQTGARWRVRRVERMAALCCVLYGDQWDAYWRKAVG